MQTLIFNGSPRPSGDTASLIRLLTTTLDGEYKIISAYYANISPCIDCRYCCTHQNCAIQDEMQEVYSYIEACDNVVIASPIYFSELTGKLLDIGSRLQRYFNSRFFQKITPEIKPKRGAVILTGGGDGNMTKPYETACTLLHHMNCQTIHPPVICHNTNTRPAIKDESCVNGITQISNFLNKR